MTKRDYVAVTYSAEVRPFTSYPDQLTAYLSGRFGLRPGQTLLDVGCGRGEFLRGFMHMGLQGSGLDRSPVAKEVVPDADIRVGDVETDPFPFEDRSFDVVFAKSFLEHFYYPEKIMEEIHRVLKPGGLVLAMVPDWEVVYRTFFHDYTHRTPYTWEALHDMLVIFGFEDVHVEKFLQLPVVWKAPWLYRWCRLLARITPPAMGKHSKLIKWSKEVMLLSSARRPHGS